MSSIPPGDDIFQYEDMLCGPGNVWKQFLQIPQEHQSKLNLVFFFFFFKRISSATYAEATNELVPGYIAFFSV